MSTLVSLMMLCGWWLVCQQVGHCARLSPEFYATSCPDAELIVRNLVASGAAIDPTLAPALLRLFFHDCQVQMGMVSERESASNAGIRGLWMIERIKEAVELACPGVVSCADVVVLAAREAVRATGGPRIAGVPLGRRDATAPASCDQVAASLPSPTSGFHDFYRIFADKGMALDESVAILGAHTLGVGHCSSIVGRLYPSKDKDMGFFFYNALRLRCPASSAPYEGAIVIPNDPTPSVFDAEYFEQSSARRGLFRVDSDVALHPATGPIASRFASDAAAFFRAFSSAFVKLSLANVSAAPHGEIRRDCRLVNY